MIRMIQIVLLLMGVEVHAHSELEKFKEAYLFTHYADYSIKEYNDDISRCFKINESSLKILNTYDSCTETPNGKNAPLEKSIGECKRGKTTRALFFKSLNDCKSARADTVNGAST